MKFSFLIFSFLILQLNSTPIKASPVVTVTQMGTMDPAAAAELIETFEDGQKQKSIATVVVATNHPKLALTDSLERNSKSLLLPLGKLSALSEKLKTEYRDYLNRVNDTILNDKVSVIVITATTAVDSVVWIQATTLDLPQKNWNGFFEFIFGGHFWIRSRSLGENHEPDT